MNEEQKLASMKRERGSVRERERERGSRFNDCCAIGPDSADLVSFTNKRPCINTLAKKKKRPHTRTHNTDGHLHTHLTQVCAHKRHTYTLYLHSVPLRPISEHRMTASDYLWLFPSRETFSRLRKGTETNQSVSCAGL